MGNLISSLMVSPLTMRQLLNYSLATIIKGGVKNDENVNITKRKNKKKKKKNKNKKKKQHNNHDTETPAPSPAPTEPALYRFPGLVKTVGNFKLHSRGGEFTQSQIIVIQGVKDTGKTTLLRLLGGFLKPDSIQFKMPEYNVSYKPQKIGLGLIMPLGSNSTVRDLLHQTNPDDPQYFESDVLQPLLIHQFMDQKVMNLTDSQLQRLHLCMCLGKPADIYLIDEPSAYLTQEEIQITAKVIKSFILHTKKIAFVAEPNTFMALQLNDKVILCDGNPATDCTANPPKELSTANLLEESILDETLRGNYYHPELDSNREGAGGNWGTQTDEIAQTDEEENETEKDLSDEEPDVEDAADGNKESSATEYEEEEPETKWYTVEEFNKLQVERKALFRKGMKWNKFWTKPETE